MDNLFNSPKDILEGNIQSGKIKGNLPFLKMVLLGIMAGMFIAIGGSSSSLAVHNISNVGLARTLAGCIFPVGLMMIICIGGELFTGNCMMITAVIDKKIKIRNMIFNLVVVYISNLIGSLIVDLLVFYSGQLDYTNGMLGAYTIKVAIGKVNMPFLKAFTSGIMCNILVCIAVLMASAAKDITGKLLGVFFPICAFVIGGYEHCVANMFYIPSGMLASTNLTYVQQAKELYGITQEQIDSLTITNSLNNFIPVTLGNIIGGAVLVGLMLYLIHKVNWGKKENK